MKILSRGPTQSNTNDLSAIFAGALANGFFSIVDKWLEVVPHNSFTLPDDSTWRSGELLFNLIRHGCAIRPAAIYELIGNQSRPIFPEADKMRILPSPLLERVTTKFEANEHQLVRNERIGQILKSFKNIIANNNGIKRKNILSLVIPLGVDYSKIDHGAATGIHSEKKMSSPVRS